MAQVMHMSKKHYSERHDEMAGRLYRLAIYILGDGYQAESVMMNTFVEGYACLLKSELSFEDTLLKRLVKACECCKTVRVKKYRDFFDGRFTDKAELLFELSKYDITERAVLLLVFIEKCDIESIAHIFEMSENQLRESVSRLCFSLNGRLSA